MSSVGEAIASAAPPNTLRPEELLLRPGPGHDGVVVDPRRAGWRYLSFRTVALAEGERFEIAGLAAETAVVTLSGGATIETDEGLLRLPGRRSAFDGLPWACHLPVGTRGVVVGHPRERDARATLAIARAPGAGADGGSRARRPVVIDPAQIAVEVRGAGNATRQVNHIITPGFPAERLLLVEVLTPSGNWSSWPPHKHDVDDMPREAVLEEIYLYQFRTPDAWGIQRLYRADRSRDALWEVRHGDLVLVTDGYHPFVAAHGHDAYYLNALAGDRRTMACSDDPTLAWTREAWATMVPDPRVPLVPASTEAT